MRTLARNALQTCTSPEQIYGVVRYPENSYFGIFNRQPIGSPYGSLCIRGLRRIRSPPVSVNNHTVNHRFIGGTRSALCSWLPTSGTTPFCLCKPFSCKACPGNSQQRRALAVPRLNRWSTAGQPLVNRTFCSSTGLHRISFVRACEETFRTVVYGTLGARGTVAFGADRNVGTLVCPASPRPTVRDCEETFRTVVYVTLEG